MTTTPHKDHIQILRFAETTSREAGALLRRAYDEPISITHKGKIDLVTQADRESEQYILSALQTHYPEHAVLAEESGGLSIGEPGKSVLTWLIDPLDGTTNFAHRFPVFAVSMGARDAQGFLVGVVYDPLRDECFSAARGQGAFLNGARIHVTSVADLGQALVATGFPYDRHEAHDNNTAAFARFQRRAQGVRRAGSAALDLAYVACGRLDAFWELRLHAWDVAAGTLVVREAGGKVTDYRGNEDSPELLTGQRIVASNTSIHEAMIETLREVYAEMGDA